MEEVEEGEGGHLLGSWSEMLWTLEKMHPLDKSHHVCCQEEEVEDWEVERD